MRRRQQGEGSVYQRAEDGLWVAVADLGWSGGKRDRRYFAAKTQAGAREKRAAFEHTRRDGFTLPKGRPPTVGDWCLYWLHHIIRDEVEPTTWHKSYRQKIEDHVAPFFARVRLSNEEMDEAQVRAFKRHLQAKAANPAAASSKLAASGGTANRRALSPTTVQQCMRLLSQCLKAAVVEGRLQRNPCQNVRAPSRRTAEPVPPAEDEVARILAVCEGWRTGARWVAGMAAGLRQGEVLGLLWPHVDLDGGSVAVEWELVRLPWQHGCGDGSLWAAAGRVEPVATGGVGVLRRALPADRVDVRGGGQDQVAAASASRAEAFRQERQAISVHHGVQDSPCGITARRCPWRFGGGLRLKRPKTARSRATVPLAPYAAAALRSWKARQAAERLACGSWTGWQCGCGTGHTEQGRPGAVLESGAVWPGRSRHRDGLGSEFAGSSPVRPSRRKELVCSHCSSRRRRGCWCSHSRTAARSVRAPTGATGARCSPRRGCRTTGSTICGTGWRPPSSRRGRTSGWCRRF